MCDYSLHGLPNRLAQEGEDLVAHRFPTGAIGLTSPAELCRMADSTKPQKKGFWSLIKSAFMPPGMPEIPAVCVPPGAKLRMLDIPANLQTELGVSAREEVIFTQTGLSPHTYHDAVRFSNGRQILLQLLREGQRVQVLSLALDEHEPEFARLRLHSESLV
ncbi:MAG: hypothetical protein DMG57_36950 [Acidobacteria bacterium]|nr:MAG: hypothetical protein DMG57_36950 [Acidobacteriota bacterium]